MGRLTAPSNRSPAQLEPGTTPTVTIFLVRRKFSAVGSSVPARRRVSISASTLPRRMTILIFRSKFCSYLPLAGSLF